MALDKKQKLLIGLVLLLVLMVAYRMVSPFRQQTVSKLTYARTNIIADSAAKTDGRNPASRPTKIKTDLMVPPPRLEQAVYRDPFRRPVPKTAARASQPASEKPAPRVLTPDERARESLNRFKAFGSFQQGDRTSLFLQRGKQVLVINIGDRIDGKFKIEAIDGRRVVVSTEETPDPFQFEFEELKTEDLRPVVRSTASTRSPAPIRRPPSEPPLESEEEFIAPDETEDAAAEEGEESEPPSLPAAPPAENPAPPFKSSESPSRSYLPGTRPID